MNNKFSTVNKMKRAVTIVSESEGPLPTSRGLDVEYELKIKDAGRKYYDNETEIVISELLEIIAELLEKSKLPRSSTAVKAFGELLKHAMGDEG